MKKLMMAAAIVCAAVCSYGASITWGNFSYSIDNWNGNQAINDDLSAPMYDGGKMFLYLGTVSYDSKTGFDTASATLALSAIYNADEYGYGTFVPTVVDSTTGLTNAGGQNYTLVLVEGTTAAGVDDLTKGQHFVLRTATSTQDYDAELSDYVGNFTDTTGIEKGDWQVVAGDDGEEPTPEPTSGLLLLLGVAGMALRRRQA